MGGFLLDNQPHFLEPCPEPFFELPHLMRALGSLKVLPVVPEELCSLAYAQQHRIVVCQPKAAAGPL